MNKISFDANELLAYFNGEYLEKSKIAISPDDRGFLFADALYEVIRCVKGSPFRLDEHLQRLEFGAKAIKFTTDDYSFLREIVKTLLELNKFSESDSVIYIQVSRGVAPRTHHFPAPETEPTVFVSIAPYEPTLDIQKKGIKTILMPDQRWARCNLKTVALTANVLAQQAARVAGCGEALFVRDGFVMEGSHTNIFAVKNNELLTPPLSNYILAGITRYEILSICKECSIACRELPIMAEELFNCQEVMVVGTTMDITPVLIVDEHIIGSGQPGPIAHFLQEKLMQRMTS